MATNSAFEWKNDDNPVVGIIMGSNSDWPTMKLAALLLRGTFDVPLECRIVSAHRTPQRMVKYANTALHRGIKVIIAGAGGAAHLPGMTASETPLPVIGVPVQSKALSGVDSLYSIVQMPPGVPVMTMAIGNAGATNAAVAAVRILALSDPVLAQKLDMYIRSLENQPEIPFDEPAKPA